MLMQSHLEYSTMEARAQSNGKGKKRRNETETSSSSSLSSLSEATIAKVSQQRKRRLNPGTRSIYLDNKTPHYEWLLPGWVVEERHMESGRVYRYYYDPDGNVYNTKAEALDAEEAGMVFIKK